MTPNEIKEGEWKWGDKIQPMMQIRHEAERD
jgi:hypothetical protein